MRSTSQQVHRVPAHTNTGTPCVCMSAHAHLTHTVYLPAICMHGHTRAHRAMYARLNRCFCGYAMVVWHPKASARVVASAILCVCTVGYVQVHDACAINRMRIETC